MFKPGKFTAKLFRFVAYSTALLVVLAALLVSLSRFILSDIGNYHQDIESRASALSGMDVRLGNISARMSWFTPIIQFNSVSLTPHGEKRPLLTASRVEVGLSLSALVQDGRVLPELITVSDVDVDVQRNSKGRFLLQGRELEALLSGDGEKQSEYSHRALMLFLSNSRVNIINSRIDWTDYLGSFRKFIFTNVDIKIRNSDERHRLHASMRLPETIGSTLQVDIDMEGDITKPDQLEGSLFIKSYGTQLSALSSYLQFEKFSVNQGVADIGLWLSAKSGKLTSVESSLSLYNLEIKNNLSGKTISPTLLSGMLKLQRTGEEQQGLRDWQLDVKKFQYAGKGKPWKESSLLLRLQQDAEPVKVAAQLSYARLEDVSEWIEFLSPEKSRLAEIVGRIEPSGDVKRLRFRYAGDRQFAVDGRFENISMQAWQKLPSVKGMSGNLVLTQDGGSFTLNSQYASIGFPKVFRKSFNLNSLYARADFNFLQQGVYINVPEVKLDSLYATGQSSLQLFIPSEGSPHMSLQAQFVRANADYAAMFYPVNIMKKNLLDWLDSAISSANVSQLGIVFNGSLHEFPFRQHQGQFRVEFMADNARLKFQPDWPALEQASYAAVFTGQGMELELSQGKISGASLKRGKARIDDFSSPSLLLDVEAEGKLQQAVHFLTHSPVLSSAAGITEKMMIKGLFNARFHLKQPLSSRMAKTSPRTFDGEARIDSGALSMLENRVEIASLDGVVKFNEMGQYSNEMKGLFNDRPARFKLSTHREQREIRLSAEGNNHPGSILQRFELPGAGHIKGSAAWTAEMIFPTGRKDRAEPRLEISSTLDNVNVDLPLPFQKQAGEKKDMHLSISFPKGEKTEIAMTYGQQFNSLLLLRHQRKSTVLEKGEMVFASDPAHLPTKRELVIRGALSGFKPQEWITAFDLDKNTAKKPSFFVNPIKLQLQKFHLYEDDTEKKNQDKNSSYARRDPPTHLPTIYGSIDELAYGKDILGSLSFSSSRIANGMKLDAFSLINPYVVIKGNGSWTGRNQLNQTRLQFSLSAPDLGNMLSNLGFTAIIEKGNTQASADIYWEDTPSEFSLARLNGKINLEIKKGNIRAVDVGAGRLLGLLSLSALPRRLFGDFSDIGSGFSFDRARGSIDIVNGDVFTEKFQVESTVGEVWLNGRMGLAKRDYDQDVLVIPNVSGTASTIGALAVNLPFGVGVWLMDKLTGEKMDQAAMRHYHISGSWEKPIIKEVKDDE